MISTEHQRWVIFFYVFVLFLNIKYSCLVTCYKCRRQRSGFPGTVGISVIVQLTKFPVCSSVSTMWNFIQNYFPTQRYINCYFGILSRVFTMATEDGYIPAYILIHWMAVWGYGIYIRRYCVCFCYIFVNDRSTYCRACAASDMGLSASVPLPIVMGIFVLLGFQSS